MTYVLPKALVEVPQPNVIEMDENITLNNSNCTPGLWCCGK